MNFDRADRLPYFEEGIREDVFQQWYKQGLPEGTDLSDIFTTDLFYELDLNFHPLTLLNQAPNSQKEISSLRDKLNEFDLNKIWSDQKKSIQNKIINDQVFFLKVHSGFFLTMGIMDWSRFEEVMFLLIEKPKFVQELMGLQCEIIANYLEIVLEDIDVDAIIFNEPIGGNEGPLISATMYEDFALYNYQQILDVTNKYDINTKILRTYANMRLLVPSIIKHKFNCLWACETDCEEMEYINIRKEFGKELSLIGGIDLDCLRLNHNAIKRELENKIPSLLKLGGYIPLADGRVRKEIPFENYIYYRELLEKMTS